MNIYFSFALNFWVFSVIGNKSESLNEFINSPRYNQLPNLSSRWISRLCSPVNSKMYREKFWWKTSSDGAQAFWSQRKNAQTFVYTRPCSFFWPRSRSSYNIRYLLIATWGFYPIAYAIGTWGGAMSPESVVAVQVGYTIADITAKALYGVMIFVIAYQKSKEDGSLPSMIEEKQLSR